MSLWGNSTSSESRPKFLPVDSNAAGSGGARENAIATTGGWGLSPGIAASGNDNKAAQPEILVCIRNLAAARGSATIQTIDWTQGAVDDTGTFDITVTFDEAIDVTSGSWSADQVTTNKAYILLSRLGVTDMVEDNTMACMYYSGSGTNQIVFRGTAQTSTAGYLALNGAGVGDSATAGEAAIAFAGTAAMDEEDGSSALALRQEGGTVSAPADKIVLDSTAAVSGTVNGAITTATTALVLDGNSGTIVAGMKVYSLVGATSLSDAQGSTACSHDGTLTVSSTNGSTSVTLNKAITVANNVDLNFSADGHDEILANSVPFTLAGVDGASNIMTGVPFTGGDSAVYIGIQENGTPDNDFGEDKIILNGTNGASADAGSGIVAQDKTSDIAVYTEQGSSTGSASILNGVTVTAA